MKLAGVEREDKTHSCQEHHLCNDQIAFTQVHSQSLQQLLPHALLALDIHAHLRSFTETASKHNDLQCYIQ